ncbi:hypothetical protein MU1_13210 [Paenibacillus glycanilyticus]|uniref:Transcriptional regulator n=1 Tax=Paenibacillus glycanilyticus TaxID=126569 RepID=A0ABQ6GBD5_9BACL|nr:hypothetical protein MU1_13210 [Paenibacillus glycanilyticus]
MAGWARLKDLLVEEVKQRSDEACLVDGFLERIEESGDNQSELMAIYAELCALELTHPNRDEPDELEEIRRLRPNGPR